MPASFVFSSVWSYQPVAIAVLVYLQFAWGSAPAPLSGRVCCLLASVGSLPLSKLSAGASTPAIFCRLVYLEFACGSAPPHSRTECATGGSASPPYSGAQGTLLSLVRVLFFSFLFIIQVFLFVCFVFFFLWAGGQSVQGAMLIFLRGGCGSAKQVRRQCLVA
jgi:hypothetical protein